MGSLRVYEKEWASSRSPPVNWRKRFTRRLRSDLACQRRLEERERALLPLLLWLQW